MKYRKKPIVIEATQFFNQKITGVCTCDINMKPHIHTLKGIMYVSEGDWIITGLAGEIYSCKSEIFEATYEKEN